MTTSTAKRRSKNRKDPVADAPTIPAFASLDQYLGEFAPAMAVRVSQGLRPLFDPEQDRLSEQVKALTRSGMVPYPAQAVSVEGLARLFASGVRTAILNGEMGTGKTPMGLWIGRVLETARGMEIDQQRPLRMLISAPNHLTKRWARHAAKILPHAKVTIVNNWRDLLPLTEAAYTKDKDIVGDNGGVVRHRLRRLGKPTRTEVWILPRDRGKLGYSWRPAAISRRYFHYYMDEGKKRRVTCEDFFCPGCGEVITTPKMDHAGVTHFANKAGRPSAKRCCTAPRFKITGKSGPELRSYGFRKEDGRTPVTCVNKITGTTDHVECGTPLWQAHSGHLGPFSTHRLPAPGVSPRRFAPCAFLKRLGVRFDLYLADEVHELKGGNTLQGQMLADLCNISERHVLLTGTLVGGYADNLLHILWRTVSHRLRSEGLMHCDEGYEAFVKLYGVSQERKRYVAQDGGTGYDDLRMGRGKLSSCTRKSLPGISPLLFVNYLLDKAVFVQLREMSSYLPTFTMKVHAVPMDPVADAVLADMQKAYKIHKEKCRPCRAWSGARSAFLRWPDKPWVPQYDITEVNEDGIRHTAFRVWSLPKKEYPKERRVRRLALRNKLRGRKSWIFTELTGQTGHPAWDWMDYLAAQLAQSGLRVAVLRSTAAGGPKPEDREEWIAKTAPTVDCVISHPTLVSTGLDLYDFPSLIFAFPGDNTYRLRQASRRAWRIGQRQPCEVDFVVYTCKEAKSVQEAALSLMGSKMEASLAIEGDFSGEGLAALSGGEDVSSQLAKFIDGALQVQSAVSAFESYKRKLDAVMPDLGSNLEPGMPELPADVESADDDPPLEPTPDEAPPIPVEEPGVLPQEDLAPTSPAFQSLQRLGFDVAELLRPAAPPVEVAPEPEAPRAPARPLSERKLARLQALVQVVGRDPDESVGDRHRFGDQWVQLVAKHRDTVRARNFAGIMQDHPDALIAFVEPLGEEGPVHQPRRAQVDDQIYVVSGMKASAYLNGDRVPGTVAFGGG